MQQVNIIEVVDVQGMIDSAMGPWVQWSEQVTNQINEVNSQIADIIEINTRQGKKINALSSRIAALEEAIAKPDAPGTYQDTY